MSRPYWDANSIAGSGTMWTTEVTTRAFEELERNNRIIPSITLQNHSIQNRNNQIFYREALGSIDEMIGNVSGMTANMVTSNAVTESNSESLDIDAIRNLLEQAELNRPQQDEIINEFMFDYNFIKPGEFKIQWDEPQIEAPSWKVLWNQWVDNLPMDKRSVFTSLAEEVEDFEKNEMNKKVHDIIKEKLKL